MAKDTKDIVIYDEEFQSAGYDIEQRAQQLIKVIDDYVININNVIDKGIKDDLISNRLKILSYDVQQLKEPLNELTDKAKKCCSSYIDEIDKADSFLY